MSSPDPCRGLHANFFVALGACEIDECVWLHPTVASANYARSKLFSLARRRPAEKAAAGRRPTSRPFAINRSNLIGGHKIVLTAASPPGRGIILGQGRLHRVEVSRFPISGPGSCSSRYAGATACNHSAIGVECRLGGLSLRDHRESHSRGSTRRNRRSRGS